MKVTTGTATPTATALKRFSRPTISIKPVMNMADAT